MRRNYKILEENLSVMIPQLRSQENYKKVEKPTRPFRARTLGYKCKPYMTLIRAKIQRGGIEPQVPSKGRSPSNIARHKSRKISLLKILAQRVSRRHRNLNLLNYYPIAKDGIYLYAEFIFYQPKMFKDQLKTDKEKNCLRPKTWIFR